MLNKDRKTNIGSRISVSRKLKDGLATLLAFAAVLLVCVVRQCLPRLRRYRAGRMAARQSRQHATSIRRTLRRGATPDEVRQAVGEFLRAQFHTPAGEATPYEAFTYLTRAGVS